jgi:NitT/TauT family transport system permease protein
MKAPARWLYPLFFGVFLFSFWYAARPLFGVSRFALPWPHEVLAASAERVGELFPAAMRTLFTAGAGFVAAFVVGMGLAFLMALRPWARVMLFPWALAVQMMPLVVLIPLIVLWFGGIWPVLIIAFLMAVFPITASAVQGLLSADPQALELFRLNKASPWQFVWHLRLPGALPYIMTGAQISASLAIVGALTGEMFAGEVTGGHGGLGYVIILCRAEGDTGAMLGAGLTACVMGFVFVGAVQMARRKLLCRWHESFSERQEESRA